MTKLILMSFYLEVDCHSRRSDHTVFDVLSGTDDEIEWVEKGGDSGQKQADEESSESEGISGCKEEYLRSLLTASSLTRTICLFF